MKAEAPILFQHLFWFLGHPEVYIIILACHGNGFGNIVSQFPKTDFRLYGDGGFIVCHYYPGLPGLGAPYVCNGIESFPRISIRIADLLIAVPSAIKVFNWLTTLWRGNIRFTPAMLFAIGFVSLFISGGLTGIFLGNSTLDIHLHDTIFRGCAFPYCNGCGFILRNVLPVFITGSRKCLAAI